MRVLALDPGERVGWARADIADDGTWTDFRHGITPLREMALAVYESLVGRGMSSPPSDYDVVVVEDWRLYATKAREMIGSAFPSVQFVGMVKLCCWLSNTKYVTQGAGITKTADKTLKALWPEMFEIVNKPIAHDDGHDLDAIRHLWYFTFRHTTIHTPVVEAA